MFMLYTLLPSAWKAAPLMIAYPANGKLSDMICSATTPIVTISGGESNSAISCSGKSQNRSVPTDISPMPYLAPMLMVFSSLSLLSAP